MKFEQTFHQWQIVLPHLSQIICVVSLDTKLKCIYIFITHIVRKLNVNDPDFDVDGKDVNHNTEIKKLKYKPFGISNFPSEWHTE